MQKLTFFLITAVTAILSYLGLSTFVSVSENDEAEAVVNRPAYDGYSEGINTVMYDVSGDISYTLRAERQYHFADQSSDLEQPYIRLFREGDSHWNIVADSGRLTPAEDADAEAIGTIRLSGAVEVFRLDDFGNRTLLQTDYLELDPHEETMETDRLVTMTTTNIRQVGTGMFADLTKDELEFYRDNEGIYENISDL